MLEYKILRWAGDPTAQVDRLNELGEEGWELVTVVRGHTSGLEIWYYYLKRERVTS